MNPIKVLVVDDDSIICKLLVTYLQHHGFEATNALSGEEAVEMLEREYFHAVITDLKMGKVNGQDVIRYAKKVAPETTLIMMTGSCKEENKVEALKNGADNFFYKPFSLNELLNALPSPRLSVSAKDSHFTV